MFFPKSYDVETLRDIKEQCCSIPNGDLMPIVYKLPDGTEIPICEEVQGCPADFIFEHELVCDTIVESPMDF